MDSVSMLWKNIQFAKISSVLSKEIRTYLKNDTLVKKISVCARAFFITHAYMAIWLPENVRSTII
jgi:hypothetical protein